MYQLEDQEVNKYTRLDIQQSSVTVSRLLTSSKLGDVTNELLSSARVEAPVCVGISEYCIADGIAMGLYNKIGSRYPIETQDELYYGVTPSHHVPMQVFVDVSKKKIRIYVALFWMYTKTAGQQNIESAVHVFLLPYWQIQTWLWDGRMLRRTSS